MEYKIKLELIDLAQQIISGEDKSHDFAHAIRVLNNAEQISSIEGGDPEIIVPAALFHDCKNYPKNDSRAEHAAEESAEIAGSLLKYHLKYSEDKITKVQECIVQHSFSKGIKPLLLESKIVQDADRLECTGAIAIMRTFCSTGQMQREFYHKDDPFCEQRAPSSTEYALDLFYNRLLVVRNLMNTETAKNIAESRTKFLYDFLNQLKTEIK
jgi:uncharacterized protein